MLRARKLGAGVAASVLLAGLGVALAPAAEAGPVFPVMNTSETPPDGVWFRNSSHQADTNRETGFGVYAGEQMSVDCYSWGDPVGPYNNHVWYRGLDVSRPIVNGHSNYGYMNTHYVNDGMTADHAYPGIPSCNAPPPPPPPPIGKLVTYYSGSGNAGSPKAQSLSVNRNLTQNGSYDGRWSPATQCVPDARSVSFADKDINRLAGWSIGRLGPIYALKYLKDHNPAAASRINYVILFDPGAPSDFGTCDYNRTTVQADSTLAWWLGLSGDNRLIIMSGDLTATNHHQTIQNAYFPAIKQAASAVRQRVLVCNYSLSHDATYNNYAYLMTSPSRLATTQGLVLAHAPSKEHPPSGAGTRDSLIPDRLIGKCFWMGVAVIRTA